MNASISYHNSDSASSFTLSPLPFTHTCPNGRVYHYTLTFITRKCLVFEALHSDARRTFGSAAAFHHFWRVLKAHLDSVNAVKLLPAVAALDAPTTEHVITLDDTLLDVSYCASCKEVIYSDLREDGKLCPTCDKAQAEVLSIAATPIDPRDQLRALKQELQAMFTDICTNAEWKAKRSALLEQIASLESKLNSDRPSVAMGEYYHGLGILEAVRKYESKYPLRTVTAITINSEYETDITDVKGVQIKMSGAVRPNTVWVGGK